MIQPLRTVHRRAFVTLAFVLPVIVVVGLGARRPRPAEQNITEITSNDHLVKKSDTRWRKHAIRSGFYTDSNQPQDIFVVFEPAENLGEPDLLIYWTGNEPQAASLPAQARLLGSLAASRTFALPKDVNGPGYLVLYGLAHRTVVDTAAVEKQP